MNSALCIGIASKHGTIALAALQAGRPALEVDFPATALGVAAIKIVLADSDQPVRLAVAGAAALSLALALGNGPGRETFIVSPAVADQPVALARYAERMS